MDRFTRALAFDALTVGYHGRIVIPDFSVPAIEPGTVASLIGPNAAGKTTLLRAIAGLHPARGSIRLEERELLDLSLADRARLVTYMPQSLPQKVALTVLDTVIAAFRASPLSGDPLTEPQILDRAMQVIERVGIEKLALTSLDQLSGGQRQLASLAQALARAPAILLLDEPISALDLHYQLRVMKLVRELAAERGISVIMVLHDLTIAARWSDRIIVLKDGRVAADGHPRDAITSAILADVYHVRGEVHAQGDHLHIVIDDIIA